MSQKAIIVSCLGYTKECLIQNTYIADFRPHLIHAIGLRSLDFENEPISKFNLFISSLTLFPGKVVEDVNNRLQWKDSDKSDYYWKRLL